MIRKQFGWYEVLRAYMIKYKSRKLVLERELGI
jgi:hypothetical protein